MNGEVRGILDVRVSSRVPRPGLIPFRTIRPAGVEHLAAVRLECKGIPRALGVTAEEVPKVETPLRIDWTRLSIREDRLLLSPPPPPPSCRARGSFHAS